MTSKMGIDQMVQDAKGEENHVFKESKTLQDPRLDSLYNTSPTLATIESHHHSPLV
jgi:hypothetical protein